MTRFAGKPLRLRVDESGIVIYSVGRNQTDDRGRTQEEDVDSDDLPARLVLPKKRR